MHNYIDLLEQVDKNKSRYSTSPAEGSLSSVLYWIWNIYCLSKKH